MKKFLLILICTVLCAIGVYAQESYTIKFANSANGATQIQTSTKDGMIEPPLSKGGAERKRGGGIPARLRV